MKKAFPTTLEAVFLVIGLYLAQVVAGAALQDFRKVLGLDAAEMEALSVVIANGLIISLALQLADIGYRDLFHDKGALPVSTHLLVLPLVLALVPGLMVVVAVLLELLAVVAPFSRWEEILSERPGGESLAMLVSVCVLAPVLEEMLFRGIVLRGFLARFPRWYAIAASAILFGAAHLNLQQFCVGLVLGLVLGWIHARTRSLLPCIALHAGYNVAVTWYALQAQPEVPDRGAWVPMLAITGVALFALQRVLRPPPTAQAGQPLTSRL